MKVVEDLIMSQTSDSVEIINEEPESINTVNKFGIPLVPDQYVCDNNQCHNFSSELLTQFIDFQEASTSSQHAPINHQQELDNSDNEAISTYQESAQSLNMEYDTEGLDGTDHRDQEINRDNRLQSKGLLAAAEYVLRESTVKRAITGRLLRREWGHPQSTSDICRKVQMVNKCLAERPITSRRVPKQAPAITLGLCHKYGHNTTNDYEGILHQFYGCVKRRMERLGSKLFDTFRNNSRGARRILHDSIEYEQQRHGGFEEMVEKLIGRLNKGNGAAIFFHDEDGVEYPTDISRGFYPEFDFCIFKDDEIYKGKSAIEPIEEDETDIDPFGRRRNLEFNDYQYYYDFKSKKIQASEGGWEEESRNHYFPYPIKGHFHILHACTWYNQECRCLSRHFDVNKRKNNALRSDSLSEQHIRNIMFYNTKWPRWAVYIKVSDTEKYRFVYRTESIREAEVRPVEQDELEGSSSALEVRRKRNRSGSTDDKSDCGFSNNKNSRTSEKGECVQKIIRLLQQKPTWPIEHALQTLEWLSGPFGTWVASDKTVKRAVEIISLQTMHYTYLQFIEYYRKEDCMPIWGAPSYANFEDYYHSFDVSIDIVEQLLSFQCDNNEYLSEMTSAQAKKIFINDLWDILEKKRPKQNTFQIIGEPSAGKNYFIDAILSFYINTGIILNFNRFSQFPLMEAVNRRVNVWNEPNFEPAALDTIKMLLAGDPLKVNVKYQKEQYLQKTPIIVLTNKRVFPNELAFEDRVCTYYWKRAPFLKNYNYKLHPMIWQYLVNTYVLENIDM